MAPKPYHIRVKQHPGSTTQEINDEPDWTVGHEHHIGYRNHQERRPGFTHDGDEEGDEEFKREAAEELENLQDRLHRGELVNFRDVINQQVDYHLRHPERHPPGWRYVLNITEDWIKNKENWPINQQKRKREQEKHEHKDDKNDADKSEQPREEHEWKREPGAEENTRHNEAYATDGDESGQNNVGRDKKGERTEYQKLREKYSPQEIALLRSLQHERDYMYNLQQNDGKRASPAANKEQLVSIDEADQFSPDNWVPRTSNLIRLTGKHPLNAEPKLSSLFDAGLITPNSLHYVRNHSAVPHLLWETHVLEVEGGKLRLSMNDLRNRFESINIPVALACDGNRRKELNMIKRSKGFNWGSGAVSCAYWKGPLLRDVLFAAGVSRSKPASERLWVNFEGADSPSEGKYATCIPLEYAIDPTNDVILAQFMNDVPLPPDHGHPVRVMIPGYVGGRCVKWLKKIWVSEKENDSYYHIWDNRVLPSFITEKDGEFATTMFNHPSTACNEQNLNSVIVKPAQGEKILLTEARKGNTYRIEGYAYDGGGCEVQRVEVSLDGGETWLYCIRKFPDAPIRHGKKFWTWLHWHVDIEFANLLRCKSISVRCWNVFKNTQPERPSWNSMGMMNNCWYVVRPEILETSESGIPEILFRHPCEPGTGKEGWMQPSTELQIADAKQAAAAPSKQFTREEIEKHDAEDNCWLVVDGKVYDATSVLDWHPGGKAAILEHAGKVHQETSDEFASIHDGYAYQKLSECILGVITDKAAKYIKNNAEAAAREQASSPQDQKLALEKHRWTPVKLSSRREISADTRAYTFELPPGKPALGLSTCQHLQLGFHFADKMVIRSYTPTKPVLEEEEDGTFELVVKTYFPDENQPGGAMGNILDCMPLGEEIEVKGPTGEIEYQGNGRFMIEGKGKYFKHVTLVLGGSGITPGYQLVAKIMKADGDKTEVKVIDANKTEKDILLRDAFDSLERNSRGQLKVTHVLSHPSEEWKGLKGHVNKDIIRGNAFEPSEESVALLCGPPGMIQKAALPVLREWGYREEGNLFGF